MGPSQSRRTIAGARRQGLDLALLGWALLGWALLAAGAGAALPASLPPASDSRAGMLREAALGVLPAQAPVRASRAKAACVRLPHIAETEDFVHPGDSALGCKLLDYRLLIGGRWAAARYGWTKPASGLSPAASAEEMVLFDLAKSGQARPVWHDRFDTGPDQVWRSITPALAGRPDGSTLVAIAYCVNGTGGCRQEFLQRQPRGGWIAIRQTWFDQLPRGFSGRIRHGTSIDPKTLTGEAGFYADDDPNCCASQVLRVELALSRGRLILRRYSIAPSPPAETRGAGAARERPAAAPSCARKRPPARTGGLRPA